MLKLTLPSQNITESKQNSAYKTPMKENNFLKLPQMPNLRWCRKNEQHLNTDQNFDHQMSLSKSKCWYSNKCLKVHRSIDASVEKCQFVSFFLSFLSKSVFLFLKFCCPCNSFHQREPLIHNQLTIQHFLMMPRRSA